MPQQDVQKTLVIGLGTAGTRICAALADRICWELGGLERAPWVRFLCIETDPNSSQRFQRANDLLCLTIAQEDYERLLRNPQDYSAIRLQEWMDEDTLKALPGHSVSTGAGNIRMVGRLAFLYPPNYRAVKNAVVHRLNTLSRLTLAEAAEKRGLLAGEDKLDLSFQSQGRVRVAVVGTLCGGTCSGLAADMGFFLRTLFSEDQTVCGYFTLPHPQLTKAISEHAMKHKANAYHALVELNHYHLMNRGEETPIRYEDGQTALLHQHPYDLTFLAMPREVGAAAEQSLTAAIADRLFLNIFVREADPAADSVNASPYDREGRAHVFCTFGLSALEFPAYQVIDACGKRLIARAFQEWSTARSLDVAERESHLEELGLTESGLHAVVLPDGLPVDVGQAISDVVTKAARASTLQEAEDRLWRLRAAFGISSGSDDDPLAPGALDRQIWMESERALGRLVARLQEYVRRHLTDLSYGTKRLEEVLRLADARLEELRQAGGDFAPEKAARRTDEVWQELCAYLRRRTLIRNTRHVNELRDRLRRSLELECDARRDAAIARRLYADQGGLVTGAQAYVRRVLERAGNLDHLVSLLRDRYRRKAEDLAAETPPQNAEVLFEPATGSNGTVKECYERCLLNSQGTRALDWREQEIRAARELVEVWREPLARALAPLQEPNAQEDWLLQRIDAYSDRFPPFVQEQMAAMDQRAHLRFSELKAENVLRQRWQHLEAPEAKAQAVAQRAKPFLRVDENHTSQGDRSGLRRRSLILVPEPGAAVARRFADAARTQLDQHLDTKEMQSPDPFRAIILQDLYRFPLSAVPALLDVGGLHEAVCRDFPTFHTRVDVPWTGLSDAEIHTVRQAEELVTLSILLEILRPRQGALELKNWQATIGLDGNRRLPLGWRQAVRAVASGERDLDGKPLAGLGAELETRITNARRHSGGETDEQRDLAFIDRVARAFRDGVGGPVPGWEPERLQPVLDRFFARADDSLFRAYNQRYGPSEEVVKSLRFAAGQRITAKVVAKRDGVYCRECGGDIGADVQEAARNMWTCQVDPSHNFGRERRVQ